MGSRAPTLTCFLVICIAAGAAGVDEDGLPRPKNFPDAPTVAYGPTPMLSDEFGSPVACEWYGFASTLFSADIGAQCLTVLRKALTNATVNPPDQMKPYLYYTLERLMDAQNNTYCYQGCFNLGPGVALPGASTPASAPLPPVNVPAPLATTPAGSVAPAPMEPQAPSSPPEGEAPAEVPPGLDDTPPLMAPDVPTTPPAPTLAAPSLGAGAFLRPSCFVAVAGVALGLGLGVAF